MKHFKIDRDDFNSWDKKSLSPLEEIKVEGLNFCCNDNGKDIQCLKCGEFWENSWIISDENDNDIENLVLSQCFDDPCGDDFIEIVAVIGCACCAK